MTRALGPMAVPPADLRAFAATLVRCLRGWDPLDAALATHAQRKQAFVDALTELSALAAEALDMEVRRLVVEPEDDDGSHLTHLVAALNHRDVLLKCKVANAVGSLCTSRVAGQRLLELHGEALVASLGRMATSKNTWAQADAFFVFGWIVVIGEDALVQHQLVRFVTAAIKLLTRNLHLKPDDELDEQDANLRIYGLVFLLNFSQRDVATLAPQLVPLLEMLQLLASRLAATTARLLTRELAATTDEDEQHVNERIGEHVELVRLTVTLLNAVVDHVDEAPAVIISLKMLPQLLKLEQTLYQGELESRLRAHADDSYRDLEDQEAEDVEGLNDLRERVRCIKEIVLAQR